jgi:hypothetical protein
MNGQANTSRQERHGNLLSPGKVEVSGLLTEFADGEKLGGRSMLVTLPRTLCCADHCQVRTGDVMSISTHAR